VVTRQKMVILKIVLLSVRCRDEQLEMGWKGMDITEKHMRITLKTQNDSSTFRRRDIF
jgi:hypothetical protein